MKDERINQLIEKHKKYAENAKATVHMCDDESDMLTDALNYWQECGDVISCCEELKRLREEVEVYKRAFDNACKVYADMAGADVELFKRDMLEDARELN